MAMKKGTKEELIGVSVKKNCNEISMRQDKRGEKLSLFPPR